MKISLLKDFPEHYLKVFLLLSCCFVFFVRGDLPVHCKREAIDGNWYFYLEDQVFQPSLKDLKTTCGHGFPDKIETTVGDKDFSFAKSTEVKLKLASDYKVYEDDTTPVGTWTPVYDEGFIVNYRNSVFTAFMKYYKKSSESDSEYVSNCNKTMIGWYIPDTSKNNKDWKCFYGLKDIIVKQASSRKSIFMEKRFVDKANEESNKAVKQKNMRITHKNKLDSVFDLIGENVNVRAFVEVSEEVNMKSAITTVSKMSLQEQKKVKYEDQKEIVNEINSMNLGWKADINEEFVGMSLLELNEHLGLNKVKRHKKHASHKSMNSSQNPFKNSNSPSHGHHSGVSTKFMQLYSKSNDQSQSSSNDSTSSVSAADKFGEDGREVDSDKIRNIEQVQKYLNTKLEDINENTLAKNWDWRNVGGVNFVSRLRKQGKCGSCYIFSTISSLESRLRIQSNNNDQTEFSRQFPLSCSFYTEGCEGGYPILVAKFFNEFEIVPESCMEYKEANHPCEDVCDYTKNKKKYIVSKYGYLGGFYGATSEVLMMKEIRARGPIPGNITVPWSFSYYKNGIFSHTNILKNNSGKLSKATLFDKRISWEKVDHSITLVGWGEENGVKFWIGMNTWGQTWGENGFFRILRGENEESVESMGDSFNIQVLDR